MQTLLPPTNCSATLDTTSRRVFLAPNQSVVLSDTVGFILDLPHALVAAFRATLEEVTHADLLLHVVDASSPMRARQIKEVNSVLAEIGAQHIPQVLVFNKIDRAPQLTPGLERDDCDRIAAVRLSALTGAGLERLARLCWSRSRVSAASACERRTIPAKRTCTWRTSRMLSREREIMAR